MTLLRALLSVIGCVFRFFSGKSSDQKLGETEARLESVQKAVEVQSAMLESKKPESDSELESTLRSGKLSLLLVFFLFACSSQPAIVTCPDLKNWTRVEQNRMADELILLPKDSVVRSAMKDYAYVRNQIRACNSFRE